MKPIDDDELVSTMQKLENAITPAAQIQHLRDNLNAKGLYNKLTIATIRGITFLEIADIVALEADSNYTKIYLINGETILASKTLSYFDDLLSDRPQFFRTHKQYIINLTYIKEYLSGENNLIQLRNGLQIRLARTRRQAFLELFKL